MRRPVVAAVVGVVLSACSSARPPPPAPPPAPRAPAAAPEAPVAPPPIRAVRGDVKPYLLATPEESARIARAMARGIAVVRHDGRELVLLDECTTPGSYGFLGHVPRRARVSLRGADEIQSNAPWRAAAHAKVPRVASGSEPLDFDTLVVGVRATTRPVVAARDLTGSCAGATHFIRSVTVGSHVSPRAAGDAWPPDACDYAKPDSLEAPTACAALVSAHLVPLGDRDAFREAGLFDLPRPACPDGLVRTGLTCVVPSGAGYQCDALEGDKCEEQCARGHAGSCALHAVRLSSDPNTDRAVVARLLERACAQSEPIACTDLAWMRLEGVGGPKSPEAAERLLAMACDAGVPRACANQAALYGSSWEGHIDRATAFDLYDRSCRGADASACAILGTYHERGLAGSRWHVKALEAYVRSCEGGHPAGCGLAGDILTLPDSELPHDDVRAATLFDLGCAHGDGDACAAIGRLELQGRRATPSPDHPVEMFTRACELGSAEGCADLGERYAKKGHARRDPARARTTLEGACERGSGRGCEGAAALYAAGEGGPKDEPAARKLRERALRAYERGCANGSDQSCWGVANAARLGVGVPKDPERAAGMLSEQCRDDKQRACASLAEMLATGEAGTKDVERAKALAAKACERGFVAACPKK